MQGVRGWLVGALAEHVVWPVGLQARRGLVVEDVESARSLPAMAHDGQAVVWVSEACEWQLVGALVQGEVWPVGVYVAFPCHDELLLQPRPLAWRGPAAEHEEPGEPVHALVWARRLLYRHQTTRRADCQPFSGAGVFSSFASMKQDRLRIVARHQQRLRLPRLEVCFCR